MIFPPSEAEVSGEFCCTKGNNAVSGASARKAKEAPVNYVKQSG